MFARSTKRRAAATPGRASLSSLSADTPARPPKDLFSKDKLIHASDKCTGEKVSSFPKEIRDILRGSDTSNINGKFDSSGYGFLIIENIVHVWDVTSGMKTTKFSPPLSQKDLLPDLVTLIKMENKHGLAVCTHEGVVRVWASLLHPSDYLDANLKLLREPTAIAYCDGVGVVVGTLGGGTVGLAMVQLNPLACRPFKAPSSSSSSSWFSYLTGSSKFPSVQAILPGPRRASHVTYRELYVLTELTLQKWEIYGNTEKMQQEFPIRAWLKDELMRADNSDYVVHLQDVKFANEGVLYVLARSYLAYCPADADRTLSHHVLMLRLDGDDLQPFQHFEVPLTKPPLYDPMTYEFSSPRLAIPDFHNPSNTYAYICLEDTIVLLQGNTPEEIAFPGDKILALGTVKKSTYVVAQKTGCVKFNVIGQIETSAQSPIRQYSQQLVSSSSSSSSSSKDLLPQAIKAHASGDKHKAFILATQIGTELSEVAIQMSYSILDNAPFSESDPQWTDAANSMFIRSQIEAKKSKHIDLVNFLKDQYNGLSLWLVPIAQSAIEENGEKLVAALNLRTTQTSEGDVNRESLIQRAIKRVLDERKVEHVRSAITAQEMYYSKVSLMDEIVGVVYDSLLMVKPSTSLQAYDQASVAEFFEANRIYLAFFSALSPATMAAQRTHFNTRQLALKNLGHKYLLLAREFLRLELGEHEKELYQQIFTLTRSVLAAFAYETEANPNGSTRVQYFQVREELLRTFLPGHKDLAIRLAEEFEDFHILMLVCTEHQDKQRVYDYMHRFAKQGFPEFVFETFHKTNRYDELMSVPSEFSEQLMNYLRPYPSLAWLQFIHCQKYADASNALRLANEEEKESLGRKKVLLSLAKLSNLANSVSAPVDRRLEQQMYMLRLQKTILPNQTKPLEPKELAQSILYHSHAPVIQNVLSALDAAKNSDALLPSEERQQLIEIVWYFALEHGFEWNAVISDWKNGKIEDQALRQAIEASVIYGAAVHPNNIGLFPAASMVTVFSEFLQRMSQARPDEDPQLLARLLKAFHDVILPLPACHQNMK